MGLRAKFNLLLLVPLVIGLGLAAAITSPIVHQQARDAALQNAAIMMASAAAIGTYTDHEIAPLLAPELKVRFLPQSIPFFAAQSNFRTVTEAFPSYTFKEPALNPTNPADRPTGWEADIIDLFRREPARTDVTVERPTPDGPALTYARPIRVEAGCLQCHSNPAAAPPTMIDLYGANNGFGWKVNEVVGAAIVSVPMRVALAQSTRTLAWLMGGLLGVFAVVYITINVLLHYVVLRPVGRLASMADEVSTGNMDAPEYRPKGRDEIASLGQSFNRMRRSVANAMKLLEH